MPGKYTNIKRSDNDFQLNFLHLRWFIYKQEKDEKEKLQKSEIHIDTQNAAMCEYAKTRRRRRMKLVDKRYK